MLGMGFLSLNMVRRTISFVKTLPQQPLDQQLSLPRGLAHLRAQTFVAGGDLNKFNLHLFLLLAFFA